MRARCGFFTIAFAALIAGLPCVAQKSAGVASQQSSPGGGQSPSGVPPANAASGEQPKDSGLSEEQELANLVQESGRSPIDLVRELEKFLLRYPDSKRKDDINRAIFGASLQLQDEKRVAIYGERLLKKNGNEIGVLGPTARALVTFEDRESATRALEYGQRLETQTREAIKQLDQQGDSHERARRAFELDRVLGDSLLIQGNANGILGNTDEAIRLASQAFDINLNAESARSRSRWLEKAGRFDEAAMALADAFALPDTSDAHARDRQKMGELYRKDHSNNVGLGDLVLAGYDRVSSVAAERNKKVGNTARTKPIDFHLSSPSGPDLSLDSLRGKVVVLDFWATWCQPCRVQRPLYEQVEERFKGDGRVVFLAINSDEQRDVVPRFVKDQKWDTPVYYEDGLGAALSVTSLPTTILLDKQGELFSKLVGFSPTNFVELLSDRIREALNAKGGGATPMAAQAN